MSLRATSTRRSNSGGRRLRRRKPRLPRTLTTPVLMLMRLPKDLSRSQRGRLRGHRKGAASEPARSVGAVVAVLYVPSPHPPGPVGAGDRMVQQVGRGHSSGVVPIPRPRRRQRLGRPRQGGEGRRRPIAESLSRLHRADPVRACTGPTTRRSTRNISASSRACARRACRRARRRRIERATRPPRSLKNDAEAGAGAMLVACRLAGLSALEGHYAGENAQRNPGRRSAPGGLRRRQVAGGSSEAVWRPSLKPAIESGPARDSRSRYRQLEGRASEENGSDAISIPCSRRQRSPSKRSRVVTFC